MAATSIRVPQDSTPGRTGDFTDLLDRLNRQSVERGHDAYADVDWDGDELAIDPTDPRWRLWDFDPLAHTAWYRGLPVAEQIRVGMERSSALLKVGAQFENALQRGLLGVADRLPNGTNEFRYLHHETVEESQHSMMFQEVINRTGSDTKGMPLLLRGIIDVAVATLPRTLPEVFFAGVLAGEDPIDHLQKTAIRSGQGHPAMIEVVSIHVAEEARHVSFARQRLRRDVPGLAWPRRQFLAVATPVIWGVLTTAMVNPGGDLARRVGMPRGTRIECMRTDAGRTLRRDGAAKMRRLYSELGLMTRPARALWRLAGLAAPKS